MNKTIITLQKGFIQLPDDWMNNRRAVATIQVNLMAYGYMLSEDAFISMAKADMSHIEMWHNEAIQFLKNIMGGKNANKPLYEGFPEQIMSMNDFERYYIQAQHYWTNGKWSPDTNSFEKPIAFENIKYTILKSGSYNDFLFIFKNLVSINTSLTPQDMEVIKWFVDSKQQLVFPDAIPFKENLCTLATMGLDIPVKTPTDVLRIAVSMSGGDISLPKVPHKMTNVKIISGRYKKCFNIIKEKNPERDLFKFKHFKRKERKYLLGLLEKTHCRTDEMVLKANRWIALGEILHPGEYKEEFPKVFASFTIIRRGLHNKNGRKGKKLNAPKAVSWYGKVDKAFKLSFTDGIRVLSERPGEFMRRLDYLVRSNQYIKKTILSKEISEINIELLFKTFREIAKSSSNKVLFEVYLHFQERTSIVTNRSIFIKGARKRTELPNLPAIQKDIIDEICNIIFATLKEKFSELPTLGTCWIDEKLKNVPLPTNMRSAALSLKPTIRGTRIPLDNPDIKVIRAFVHWFNDGKRKEGYDIDLSGIFFSADGNKSKHFGWNGEHNNDFGIYSGDVTNRAGACAEYIDIKVDNALKAGFKYLIIDVRDYRFNEHNNGIGSYKDCVFGYMERDYPEANTNWIPATIKNCSSITSNTSGVLVAGIDLETKEYFMIDMDINNNTASSSEDNIWKIMKNCAIPPKFSVYDLLLMHVEARGKMILLENAPDTLFQFEDFCYSYEKVATFMI